MNKGKYIGNNIRELVSTKRMFRIAQQGVEGKAKAAGIFFKKIKA